MVWVIFIGFMLIALFDVYEEWAFSWPFREIDFYADRDVSAKKKAELSLIFHRFGWFTIVAMGVVAAASAFFIYHAESFWYRFGHFVSWGLIGGLSYLNVFNIGYALKIHQVWYYLGSTAQEDHWLVQALGHKAGKFLAFFSIGILALLLFFN